MSTTATEIQHQPWCISHVDPSAEVGPRGWCAKSVASHGVEVNTVSDLESLAGHSGIEVYAAGDTFISPEQARDVASALLLAASGIDGLPAVVCYRVRDAAMLTAISDYEIRCAIKSGALAAKRHGDRLLIPASALSAWINALEDSRPSS